MALAGRVGQIFSADTYEKTDEPNSFVIGIFDGVAGVFVITIFAAKAMGRKTAVLVGREVFVQQGQLARPSVLSSSASEAILRGWLSVKEVVQLGYLHIASGNPFIGLFSHWSHADVVFSRADKATELFAGLLLTFISTALLVDLDDSDESETDVLLKCLYRQVLSQVLLPVLPFKHVYCLI